MGFSLVVLPWATTRICVILSLTTAVSPCLLLLASLQPSLSPARQPLLSLVSEAKSREDFQCETHFNLQHCSKAVRQLVVVDPSLCFRSKMHPSIATLKDLCDTTIFDCPSRHDLGAYGTTATDRVPRHDWGAYETTARDSVH